MHSKKTMLQTAQPLRLSLCMHSCILPNQCGWFFTKEFCIYSLSTGQSSLSLFVHSSGVRPPASCNLDVKGVYFRNVHLSSQRGISLLKCMQNLHSFNENSVCTPIGNGDTFGHRQCLQQWERHINFLIWQLSKSAWALLSLR